VPDIVFTRKKVCDTEIQKLFTIRSLFLAPVVLSVNPNKSKGQGAKEVRTTLDAHILRGETVLKNANTPTTAVFVIISKRGTNYFSGGIFLGTSVSCKYPGACILGDMPVLRGGDCFHRSQTRMKQTDLGSRKVFTPDRCLFFPSTSAHTLPG
jgi:hypothetical protein